MYFLIFSDTLFFLTKKYPKNQADGSAAAQARSPRPSALPAHASTGSDAYLYIL